VSSEASPPREKEDRERSRLERIVPDLVKRLVDVGVEKLADGPENLRQILSELKLPKEAISILVSHLDDSKRELTQVVVKEIREFLERSSLADELTKLLSGLTLEIKTQVRFVPSESGHLRPKSEVRTKLGVQVDSAESADGAHVNSPSRSTVPPPSTPVSTKEPVSTDPDPHPAEQEISK
jgi:hypothetical protein